MPSSTSSGPSSPEALRSLASVRAPSGATRARTVPDRSPAATGPASSTPRRSISAAITQPAASSALRAMRRASPPSQQTHAATFAACPPGTSAIAAGTSSSGAGGASSRTTTSSSRSPSVTTSTPRSWHTRRVESPAAAAGRALVVSGGPAPDAAEVGPLPEGAFVIAADSGLEHAGALGLSVDVLVGDLDSASPEAVRAAEGAGVRVERHPVAKDATDLELALDYALASAATRVTVISGGGGERLDHHLAELVLLAAARFAPLRLDARIGTARAVAVHAGDDVSLTGRPGAVLSLLALGGPATGLTTTGVRWPLTADTLEPGSTRGVSNEILSSPVRIRLERGSLLAVGTHPLERDQ